MKKLKKVRDTPQDLETIIHSLEHYALGDIRHNRSKPIAAFILSMCFIDQLSSFRYRLLRDVNKRPEDFIGDYMKEFSELDLYDMFRHSLIHNYSSLGKFDIDNRGSEDVPFARKKGIIYINTNVFVEYLEKAFIKVVEDFRIVGEEAYNNALENSMYHPVLVDPGI
jgi:hypothetical protein